MRRASFVIVALLMVVAACSSDPAHPPLADGGVVESDGQVVDICATSAEEGCPCHDVGATTACVATRYGANGYKSCGPGVRTCGADLKWGTCVGDTVWDAGP